jgi:hypothetical protein
MSSPVATTSRWVRESQLGTNLVAGAAALLLAVFIGDMAHDPARLRLAIAGTALGAMVGVGFYKPRWMLPSLAVWLAALGFLRRVVTALGAPGGNDPLLLVLPAALVLIVLVAKNQGAFANRTRLANSVLVLSFLMLLGAVNPLQGSPVTGVAGLLFVLVPTLGFWIGRGFGGDSVLRTVLWIMAFIALPVAYYGLVQTINGFPSWDQQWINSVSYAALNVRGVVRPFSTFSSSAEYGTYLAIAVLIWVTLGLRRLTLPLALAAIPVLLTALVYQSSRGLIVSLAVSLGIVVGARMRLPVLVSLGVGAVALIGLFLAVRAAAPSSYSSTSRGALASHELQGLANPLDPAQSTFGVHLSLLEGGIVDAFRQPVGRGVGAVTIAGARFGGVSNANTELDPSNAAVSMGLPGLIAYICVFGFGLGTVYRVAVRRHDALALAGLGVCFVMLFEWLNGGQYSVAFLPWLVLGWADRQERLDEGDRRSDSDTKVPSARAAPAAS